MESVQEQNYIMGFYNNEHQKFKSIGRDHEEDTYNSEDSTSSSFNGSNISNESSSSLDELLDDASSSSLSSSSSSSSSSKSSKNDGSLYGLSDLMDQLPIKRGLSKFYQGKSQSFTSLARVTSLEDLAKKETPYQKRLKACRSYGYGLNNFRSSTQPKATISKRVSKGSSLSNLSSLTRKNSFIVSLPPLSHVQTTF